MRVRTSQLPLGEWALSAHRRLTSPLTGLAPQTSFTLRARTGTRMVVAGVELTGVHLLAGAPPPPSGGYHVGGSGLMLAEALIRCAGETTERYGQMLGEVHRSSGIRFCTRAELGDEPALDVAALRLFTPGQCAADGFLFEEYHPDRPLGWVPMRSMLDGGSVWIPAQFVFIGYQVRHQRGEPWLLPAFTTGTAAHTDPGRAVAGGLLELAQLDAVMGHWYGAGRAVRIEADGRTRAIDQLVSTCWSTAAPQPRFYLLPSPDLPGFTVACLVPGPDGSRPAIGLGTACDFTLTGAMYKALLEGVSCYRLGAWLGVSAKLAGDDGPDLADMHDLDSNVVHYGHPEAAGIVWDRFAKAEPRAAGDLAPDGETDPRGQAQAMLAAFRDTGKRLYHLDLTTPDVRANGFTVQRLWSPDVLCLSFPSSPPAAHPRFAAYGGFHAGPPHPYP